MPEDEIQKETVEGTPPRRVLIVTQKAIDELKPRQVDLVNCLAKGITKDEVIFEEMGLTESSTVGSHFDQLYKKFAIQPLAGREDSGKLSKKPLLMMELIKQGYMLPENALGYSGETDLGLSVSLAGRDIIKSKEEIRILELILEGVVTENGIGARLVKSPDTIRLQRSSMYKKFPGFDSMGDQNKLPGFLIYLVANGFVNVAPLDVGDLPIL